MSLLDQMTAPAKPEARGGVLGQMAKELGRLVVSGDDSKFSFARGEPVRMSPDLARVRDLPRRNLDVTSAEPAKKWTEILRVHTQACDCAQRWGYCIKELLPIQGVALEEANRTGSMVGLIGVGHGKTGLDILLPMVIPGVRVAVLLVPPKLRHQFLTHDFPQWSVHFRTPNLAGGTHFIPDGRPVLHLIAYSELSQAKNSDILSRLRPDLVIADEAHNLKDPKSARTKRFNRAVEEHVKFIPMSGTLTTRSPKDCAHLFAKALHDRSPFPLHHPTVEEWAGAIEASPFPKPLGALGEFCRPGENVQEGFRRRLIETPGVVATSTASIGNSLNVTALTLAVPGQVANLIDQARKGMRPDGEEAADQLTAAAWARQLSAGFYHRWIYPRGEPEELITQWFNARKAYYKETREKLKYSRDFLDSPLLLWRAAHRWHMGYTHNGEEFAPKTKRGPLPVWDSEHWEAWRTIHKEVQPVTDVVWVDPFLIDAAVEWGRKNTGIIWTEHAEFGEKVATQLGTVWYNGGGLNPEAEKGDRTIVASIKANSDGLNLQRAFSRNLMVSVPSSGKTWEQMLGRTHRQGQLVDEVEAEVFLHTEPLASAFLQARRDARYQQNITGSPQKLCYANLNLKSAVEAKEELDS